MIEGREPGRDALLKIKDLMRLLGIGRRTVYTIPFLMERVIYVGPHSPRWEPSDVEAYKRIRRGRAA